MKTLTELTENQKRNDDLYVAYIGTSSVSYLNDLVFSAVVDERCAVESIGDGAILTNQSPNSTGTNLSGVDIIHNDELIDIKHSSYMLSDHVLVTHNKNTMATHYGYYDIRDNAVYVAPASKLTLTNFKHRDKEYTGYYKADIKNNGVKYPSPYKYAYNFLKLYKSISHFNYSYKYGEDINMLQEMVNEIVEDITPLYKTIFNQTPKIIVVENHKKN